MPLHTQSRALSSQRQPGPLPGTGTDGPCRGGGEALTDARRSRADRHFLTARQREEPRGPTDGQADARWSHPCPRSTRTVTHSPQSHVHTHERRHAAQGTGTPTDPRHTPTRVTLGASPLGAQGGDMLGLLPVLCGTERAQAQVPAACLWVRDPQAAEAGCGINGEQEACQRLCGPGELWVSRGRCSPLPWAKLEQGQSTLCQAPGPHVPMVSVASPHPASCQTQWV